jgi:hypothetical protein
MNDNKHLIDPRPNLGTQLNSYERHGYKTYSALAELIDNSTASYFNNREKLKELYGDNFKLIIEIKYQEQYGLHGKLEIIDNAFGMNELEFKNAITISHLPEIQGGRNEYGMGLKTSTSWFGKTWEVTSKRHDSIEECYVKVDIKELMKNGSNDLEILSRNNLTTFNGSNHGTKIEINNLNRKIEKREFNKLKLEIESLYRRDLSRGDIEIIINGHKCSFNPYDAFEYEEDGIKVKKIKNFETKINFYDKDNKSIEYKIKGFYGILGEGNSRNKGSYDKAGFALFRKGRVIKGGFGRNYKPYEIFGKSNSPVSLRLFGEIDLDDFPVNQSKSEFDWDSNGLEEIFINELKKTCEEYIDFAKKNTKNKEEGISIKNAKEIQKIGQEVLESFPYEQDLYGIKITRNDNIVNGKIELGTPSFEFKKSIGNKEYLFELQLTSIDNSDFVSFEKYQNNELFDLAQIEKYTIKINLELSLFEKLKNNRDFIIFLAKLVISFVLSELIARKKGEKVGEIYKISSDEIRVLLNTFFKEISMNYKYDN